MPGRPDPSSSSAQTIRRLAAALDPPATGGLARAAHGPAPWLAALGLSLVLWLAAELRLDGTAAALLEGGVALSLVGCLGWTAWRLHVRDEVMAAISAGRDGLGEGLLLADAATLEIVHADRAAAAVFNRPLDELIGLDGSTLAIPADRARLVERRRLRAAGHRVPVRVALELAHPGTEPRLAECATTELTVGGRSLLLIIARDVTHAALAERRQAEEHAFLEAVLEHAAGPIVVLAPDGRLLRVNAATARLAGLAPAAMTGRTPWELGLMTAAQGAEVSAALRAGRDPFRHAIAWHGPDGRERVVAWCATAIRDEAGAIRCAVSVGTDLTEQCAAEDRARRAHAALDVRSRELERSDRDLARFAELAAHDLHTSVEAIAGYTDLLEAHTAPLLDARGRSYLGATREAAGAMRELLDGVAAYGRLGSGEAAADDVDCERTLDTVLRGLAAELDATGAEITRDPLPVVPGDPGELAALLANLVTNAVRHGAAGDAPPRVHVGAERRTLGWELTVSDRGPGVPQAERRRIFQIFRRLQPDGGAGVGLAVCRRIAERHGGAIWVDDADGGGSAFHVTLPDREAR
jgi:PAS domain S-box-containing protein